jgi:hypothetical protein
MPAFEEVKAEYTMRMIQVPLEHPIKQQSHFLNMDRVTPDKTCGVWAMVYEIDDPALAGFCPAKVWTTDDDTVVALFYATGAVIPVNRPFGTGSTYIAVFQVSPYETIEYNVDAKVAIQQIIVNHKLIYVVSFGQSEYDVIVKQDQEN